MEQNIYTKTIMKPENIEKRKKLLRAMDTVICSLNDEHALDTWLRIAIPDQASDDEIKYIAEEVLPREDGITTCFEDCCRAFTRLIAAHAKYGYYSGGVLGDTRKPEEIAKDIAYHADATPTHLYRWYIEKLNMSGVITAPTKTAPVDKIVEYVKSQFPNAQDVTEDDVQMWISYYDDNFDPNYPNILVTSY